LNIGVGWSGGGDCSIQNIRSERDSARSERDSAVLEVAFHHSQRP